MRVLNESRSEAAKAEPEPEAATKTTEIAAGAMARAGSAVDEASAAEGAPDSVIAAGAIATTSTWRSSKTSIIATPRAMTNPRMHS